MHFDQPGSDLLQQPLLSAQIIPELVDADDLLINKLMKPELKVAKPVTTQKPDVRKVMMLNHASSPKSIQIKSSMMDGNTTMQKVQIVKRIPTNLVQISDPNVSIKTNTIINENVVANTPIVINKVNGNISGKYQCYSKLHDVM